jgi:23S rRNA (pseudouridine1915-N3)-methyltransferase
LLVAAVGRIKEPGLREAVDDYYRRIRRHLPLDEHEVREGSDEKVGGALLNAIPEEAYVTAHTVNGRSYSSGEFARWLERRLRSQKGLVAFVIGGADGLPVQLMARADEELSLSPMTFPHRLARLMLAEQVYRATTILRGEPYPR